MSLSPPAAKKPTLSSEEKQISDLSDADLSVIFVRLPPFYRLIASEVCRLWHALSRKEWLDITQLDLSPIPGKYIAAIVRQCTNLRSVFALKKCFELNELASLAKSSQLSTVKLYDCSVAVQGKSGRGVLNDGFAAMFSESMRHASWTELVLDDTLADEKAVLAGASLPQWVFSAMALPASLTRLQLSCLRARLGLAAGPLLSGLEGLRNLQAFILHGNNDSDELVDATECCAVWPSLCALTSLRELCVAPAWAVSGPMLARLIASLPTLEVLFLRVVDAVGCGEHFAKLITESTLRILVLSGLAFRSMQASEPTDLPARKRFPYGLGVAPLPLLHIFVDKSASEHLRFAQSSSDEELIYPIDRPMPEFLEREDIAPLFECCWIAERIKEAAKNGGKFWRFERDNNA